MKDKQSKLTRDMGQWRAIEWIDTRPGPGAYVSSTPVREFEVHGTNVMALNPFHADMVWGRAVCQGGHHGELQKCAHCGANLRYVVVFRDEANGLHFPVGEDCAAFIESGFARHEWMEKRRIADIKESKNGSFYLSLELPVWWWELPASERPDGLSAFKTQSRSREIGSKWLLQIWGDSRHQVMVRFAGLKELSARGEELLRLKADEAARVAAESIDYDEGQKLQRQGKAIDLRASTKKVANGYKPVLKTLKGKLMWEGDSTHQNRDFDGQRGTAALTVALQELRARLEAISVEVAA